MWILYLKIWVKLIVKSYKLALFLRLKDFHLIICQFSENPFEDRAKVTILSQ